MFNSESIIRGSDDVSMLGSTSWDLRLQHQMTKGVNWLSNQPFQISSRNHWRFSWIFSCTAWSCQWLRVLQAVVYTALCATNSPSLDLDHQSITPRPIAMNGTKKPIAQEILFLILSCRLYNKKYHRTYELSSWLTYLPVLGFSVSIHCSCAMTFHV